MKYEIGYEEGLINAMLRAKIEYVAKTQQANGAMGNFIEELKFYIADFSELKKYLKYLGFRIIREYEVDGDMWLELNKNIVVSNDGFVCFYKHKRR